MAAGALVIVPDADGNLAYCRFGENCLEANHDDPGSYVKELDRLAAFDSSAVMDLRRAGYDTLHAHSLDRERDGFAAFLERILAGGPGSSA